MWEHGTPDAVRVLEPLEHARVVSRCPCGCAGVDLAVEGHPIAQTLASPAVADFVYGVAGDFYGACVLAQGGVLSGLDLYALDAADVPRCLPATDQLRPFGSPAAV